MKTQIWQEKYRPSSVKDVISIHTQKVMNALKEEKGIPNFLFYSKVGGTGKTSMAKAIIHDLGCDYLPLNASEERSIEIVRTKVKEFCASRSNNPKTKKCIWMDECEKLTKDAMDALKNMIETYAGNAFFIFTTNNISKIPEPMQTRFVIMQFSNPPKDMVAPYVKNICEKESIDFTPDSINLLVDQFYPSLRRMVNQLQEIKMAGLKLSKETVKPFDSVFNDLWKQIKAEKYDDVSKYIIQNDVSCSELNGYIFDDVITSSYELKVRVKLITILAKIERDISLGCNERIAFISNIPDIIFALKEKEVSK